MNTIRTAAVVAALVAAAAPPSLAQHPIAVMEGGDYLESLGSVVANAGDINADGWPDFVVTARNWIATSTWNARVHVFLGPIDAGALGPDQTHVEPLLNSGFGHALSAADADGDGHSDLLVGAPDATITTAKHGAAYLYRGSPSGLLSTPAWSGQSFQSYAQYGIAASFVGDVNLDGFVDAVIGAPETDDGPATAVGRAFLYLGGAAGLSATPAWTVTGTVQSDRIGSHVVDAADVNADGLTDFCIGLGVNLSLLGRVWVFHGTGSLPALVPTLELTSPGSASDQFGRALATGDWNDDGHTDLMVSAPADTGHFGRVYTFHGSPTGVVPQPATSWLGPVDNGYFGLFVCSAGDVDADGFEDALIASHTADGSFPNEGHAGLYRGGAGGLVNEIVWQNEGNALHTAYGAAMAGLGDITGNGFGDLLVAAPAYNGSYNDEGKLWVLAGDCPDAPDATTYGAGKPGVGGANPTLSVAGPPAVGEPLTLSLGGGVPGVAPLVLLGTAPAALPFDGGTLLVTPQFLLPLPPYDAGGETSIAGVVPGDPATCGIVAYLQAMYVEPSLPGPYHTAQSAGLMLTLGD